MSHSLSGAEEDRPRVQQIQEPLQGGPACCPQVPASLTSLSQIAQTGSPERDSSWSLAFPCPPAEHLCSEQKLPWNLPCYPGKGAGPQWPPSSPLMLWVLPPPPLGPMSSLMSVDWHPSCLLSSPYPAGKTQDMCQDPPHNSQMSFSTLVAKSPSLQGTFTVLTWAPGGPHGLKRCTRWARPEGVSVSSASLESGLSSLE